MTKSKANEVRIRELIYYAVDLGTALALSKTVGRQTLIEIADITFDKLELSVQGKTNMIQTINAYLPEYGAVRVKESLLKKCTMARELWKEVWTAAGDDPVRDLEV